jgi:RNA polymerase sigma-70 factor (ECF subfamily)
MIEMHKQARRTRLARSTAGEERFRAMFERFGRDVYAYARRRTNAVDAEDIVAETFAVLWRRLDDVPEDGRAWLLGVARKCLANRQRGDRRRAALVGRLTLVDTASNHPAREQPEPGLSDPVRRAFDSLPADGREALALLAWEGLSPVEAAKVLGCSRAAFYLRVHRARRRFAKELHTTETEMR